MKLRWQIIDGQAVLQYEHLEEWWDVPVVDENGDEIEFNEQWN